MSATDKDTFIVPRYCIAHDDYRCDMQDGGCEYLPQRDSEEFHLTAGSALGWHNLPDGSYVCVYAMGANLRVCVGEDKSFIDRAWCYHRRMVGPVREALTNWDGRGMPPDGWHRDIKTGMRRTNGDPAQEYFNP